MTSLRIDELPGVAVDGWDFAGSLPTHLTAVYFLCSRKHGLLYVSKAADLRGRWWNYHQCKEDALTLGDCTLRWLEVSRGELASIE
jgi:hypothetical protein